MRKNDECTSLTKRHRFQFVKVVGSGVDKRGKYEVHKTICRHCGDIEKGRVYADFLKHIFSIPARVKT